MRRAWVWFAVVLLTGAGACGAGARGAPGQTGPAQAGPAQAKAAQAGSAQGGQRSALPIHAGPVYTREADAAGKYPAYPDVAVQVVVPPLPDTDELAPENFTLSVDGGVPVTATGVTPLESAGYGVAVSVSLDVSGSMKGGPLNAVRSGLVKFVNEAGPEDKVAIQTIADDGRWEATWEDSRDQVRAALSHLAARGSLTRLWDSLLEAIDHFEPAPLAHRMIVISDGHDEGSTHSLQEVIAAAQAHGIVVDAIGVTRSAPKYLETLSQLAAQTGGQFRQARQTRDLQQLVSQGIDGVKQTPVVRFHLAGPGADGASHRFEVTWKNGGGSSTSTAMASLPEGSGARATLTKGMEQLGLMKQPRRLWWIAGGAAAAVLLLIVLIVVLTAGKKRGGASPFAVASPPVAAAPAPVATLPMGVPREMQAPTVMERMQGAAGVVPTVPLGTEQGLPPRPVAVTPRPRASTELMGRFESPEPGRPVAWLRCEQGFAPGQAFGVDRTEYWIGALESNHLQITGDPTVSGNHACVVLDHEVLGIFDYQSTNGTMVNGERVDRTRRLLRVGDRIRIGRSVFLVESAQRGARS